MKPYHHKTEKDDFSEIYAIKDNQGNSVAAVFFFRDRPGDREAALAKADLIVAALNVYEPAEIASSGEI